MHFCRPIRLLVVLVLQIALSFAAQMGADSATIRRLLSDASDIGLAPGAAASEIRLKDQNGRERDLVSLTGPKGLVLVFFRSADW